MSASNNGVSLKFIGIFAFLALTMNCLSVVSGAATDNKGVVAGCSCTYEVKNGTTTLSTNNIPCDDCLTCKATFLQWTLAYSDKCSVENDPCVMTVRNNNNGVQNNVHGTCTLVKRRWCCVNPSNSPPMGAQGTVCQCQ